MGKKYFRYYDGQDEEDRKPRNFREWWTDFRGEGWIVAFIYLLLFSMLFIMIYRPS